jgi:hypothetical protein
MDRSTHYKVLAVACALSVIVGLIGLSGRFHNSITASNGLGLAVVKAGKATHVTNDDTRVVR